VDLGEGCGREFLLGNLLKGRYGPVDFGWGRYGFPFSIDEGIRGGYESGIWRRGTRCCIRRTAKGGDGGSGGSAGLSSAKGKGECWEEVGRKRRTRFRRHLVISCFYFAADYYDCWRGIGESSSGRMRGHGAYLYHTTVTFIDAVALAYLVYQSVLFAVMVVQSLGTLKSPLS